MIARELTVDPQVKRHQTIAANTFALRLVYLG
jgi:hypothetical protein